MHRSRRRAPSVADGLVRPTAIDRYVGSRVRRRRMSLGLTQKDLAEKLGVTFQQLQKNEKGVNRIAASRLHDLSLYLDVPVQYFFDGMPAEVAAAARARTSPRGEAPAAADHLALMRAETLRLVHAYYAINSARVRKRVYELAKALAFAAAASA